MRDNDYFFKSEMTKPFCVMTFEEQKTFVESLNPTDWREFMLQHTHQMTRLQQLHKFTIEEYKLCIDEDWRCIENIVMHPCFDHGVAVFAISNNIECFSLIQNPDARTVGYFYDNVVTYYKNYYKTTDNASSCTASICEEDLQISDDEDVSEFKIPQGKMTINEKNAQEMLAKLDAVANKLTKNL